MVENTNTSVRFDSTTIRHIRLKYRYSTRPRVEYWATIQPTIRPRIMAKFQIFFELRGGVELFTEVWPGLITDFAKHIFLLFILNAFQVLSLFVPEPEGKIFCFRAFFSSKNITFLFYYNEIRFKNLG